MIGCIVNVLSFHHPHIKSLFEKGLWGFPDNKINRTRWQLLESGSIVFFYGEYKGVKGIYLKATLINKFENHKPVAYWIKNPTGYPLQILVELHEPKDLEKVTPILKEELASEYTVRMMRPPADRWSLIIFSDKKGATYPYNKFTKILEEYETRNRKITIEKPNHEELKRIIAEIGRLQRKVTEIEAKLDNYKIDVVWKKTERSVPYIAFEIQIAGNLLEALSKLKHASDIWNAIPILITTSQQVSKAKQIITGTFHEIQDQIRIIEWQRIVQLYQTKQKYKTLETKLGIY